MFSQQKSAKSEPLLRILRESANSNDQIELAVETLMDAASFELSTEFARKLLKAAAFGKLFLKTKQKLVADKFTQLCQTLKVLYSIRNKEVGLYLTYQQ